MSYALKTNEKTFIKRMTENPEQAKWGFDILLEKRPDFAVFFDHLKEAGLFSPENNIGPIESKKPGYVRIPYWSALDYLEAVAEQSGRTKDLELAEKVMGVVRSVSHYCDPNGKYTDNYHTYRKFAKILSLVPINTVSLADIDLIPIWLDSEYDRGLIAQTLNSGALKKFLDSENPDDWQKAIRVLFYCTEIKLLDDPNSGIERKKPRSLVDEYWLEKLIKNNAGKFGIKAARSAADIFCNRIQQVFIGERNDYPSYLSRPAVENHPQNHNFYRLQNCLVEGLREVLLSWTERDPHESAQYIKGILENESEMSKRICIYVINEKWQSLKDLYPELLSNKFFNFRYLHEIYQLLKNRFGDFDDPLRSATIDAIRNLPLPEGVERPEIVVKYQQRNWLSAIVGLGFEDIDTWFQELDSAGNLGKISKHPDFHVFMESWEGFGDSQYTFKELSAFAEHGTIIERLNSYKQLDSIRGTSVMSLVKQLEIAVENNPQLFLKIMPTFGDAKRPYQYGIIAGFKNLWDSHKETKPTIDWDSAWNSLFDFFEKLIDDETFWTEEVEQSRDFVPTRDWIPPKISEFIEAGTKKDESAYTPDLLPRTLVLIKILLEKSEAVESVGDDPMHQSINSPKGKAIEALFSYSLRICRVSDQGGNGHDEAWNTIRQIFDNELAKCKHANFEFSTLAGAYLVNLEYISPEWLVQNLNDIFSRDNQDNFKCAIDGLMYSSVSRPIYKLLVDNGIIDYTIKSIRMRSTAKERLIERIALAYLWADESLNSERFSYFFESKQIEDLKYASRFFWSVRGQNLSTDQEVRILEFWHKCVDLAKVLKEIPVNFLSELSRLACFAKTLTDYEHNLLLSVAPYIGEDYNGDIFIEQVIRLIEQDQDIEKICQILDLAFVSYKPAYDYEDRLKNLMLILVQKGKRDKALIYTDNLRYLSGFNSLYKELLAGDH